MVLKRRINYGGFHDLLAPVIPKAPRSLRKRKLHKKSSQGGEICAFELLAAVAGQLLQETESSTSSTNIPKEVKYEPLEVKVKAIKSDHHDQESGVESELIAQPTNLNPNPNELPQSENDSGSEHASIVTSSDFVLKINKSSRIESLDDKNVVNEYNDIPRKPELGFPNHGNLQDVKYGDNITERQIEPLNIACFPRNRGNVNINNIRDDDEKYIRYNNRSTKRRAFGSRSRAGYRRMRKLMTSRYWKSVQKMKDYELNTASGGVYHKRKNIYKKEGFQSNAASKRRKLFHHSSKTTYIKDSSSENISKNSVKFSIKSFRVPELYVEVPETATVGSLKRHVMEAVTAILQGKLHVGVLVQGKKVRDDNRTLQQTGISKNYNLENLGFMLEPSLPEASTSWLQKETQLLLSRSPSPIMDPVVSNSSADGTPNPEVTTLVEKNEESTSFPAEGTTEEQVADSKALVVVPALDADVISMVPMNEKPTKRYELSQRRTRRPFSVSEVEALVEAVETLGAGRWRDVKMRAFDDANHRTYVDLKDKWKTLVHTASIAPQQRRGEPVPQDLLDRVLAAHAYWSHHQSKQQHVKNDKTLGAQM